MDIVNTFLRVEKKFVLTRSQAEELKRRISGHVVPDRYPVYDLYNIYFDTTNNDVVSKCLSKSSYKEKIRLRSYGPCELDDKAFLEIKRKHSGLGQKRRIDITPFRALKAIRRRGLEEPVSQVEKEIDLFISRYELIPAMFITYHRTAFSGKDDRDLRITFDENIRYRTENISMKLNGNERSFTGQDTVVMEIKACGRYPFWLVEILSDMGLHDQSFSKYGKIYTMLKTTAVCRDPASKVAGN